MNYNSTQYVIHPGTMALIPSKHLKYETIALEDSQRIPLIQPAFQLIKQACLNYFSTYEGRREAVTYRTGFKRKVPIPIHPRQIMFPTHANNDVNCFWISYHHVYQIINGPEKYQSIVQFKNKQEITVPVSSGILKTQMKRALTCKLLIQSKFEDIFVRD